MFTPSPSGPRSQKPLRQTLPAVAAVIGVMILGAVVLYLVRRMHMGTECGVHIEVTGFSVTYAFDFREALDFVFVAQLGIGVSEINTTTIPLYRR
jgi:hypothetical protein